MNWHEDEAQVSPEVERALKHFKASMDAWSDAARSQPRTLEKTVPRGSWQLAAGWALACLLFAGSVTVAVHEVVHRQQMAKLAAQEAEQKAAAQRVIAEQVAVQAQNRAPAAKTTKQETGTKDEDLLASVDQDVSQQVPAAMEPLAQLMDEDGAQ